MVSHPDRKEFCIFASEVRIDGGLVTTLRVLKRSPATTLERVTEIGLGADVLEDDERAAGPEERGAATQRALAAARVGVVVVRLHGGDHVERRELGERVGGGVEEMLGGDLGVLLAREREHRGGWI